MRFLCPWKLVEDTTTFTCGGCMWTLINKTMRAQHKRNSMLTGVRTFPAKTEYRSRARPVPRRRTLHPDSDHEIAIPYVIRLCPSATAFARRSQ